MTSRAAAAVWPWQGPPSALRVDRFVLSGDPGSAAFVVDHLYVAHGLRDRLAWPVHRATRGRALCRRTAAGDLASVVHAAVSAARQAIPGLTPAAASWVIDTDYRESPRGRSVVFLFADDGRRPAVVVKLLPSGSGTPSLALAREREALDALHRTLPDALRQTVPQVLAYDVLQGWERLALVWLPGRSAYAQMHTRLVPSRGVEAHFSGAAAWLARFHDAATVPGTVVQPATSANTARREAWFDELCEACAKQPLRAVRSHGDFWARNVLFAACGAARVSAVVDWDRSCERASPLDDLFQFPLAYGLNYPWSRYRRAGPLDAFRRTFIDESGVARAVRRYFLEYCRQRGLDARVLASWFRCFLRARAAGDVLRGHLWIRCDEMLGSAGRSVFCG